MSILSELNKIQEINFPVPQQSDSDKKKLDEIIKGTLLTEVERFLRNNSRWPFKLTGNTGKYEQRAHVPWVGVHSPTVESASLEGVYVTILINSDGDGFALSIQRGVESRSDMEIIRKIAKLRVEFDKPTNGFAKRNLHGLESIRFKSSERARLYQLSSVVGKEYSFSHSLDDEAFENDFLSVVNLYSRWADVQ